MPLDREKLSELVQGFWGKEERKAYKDAAAEAGISDPYHECAYKSGVFAKCLAKVAKEKNLGDKYAAVWE